MSSPQTDIQVMPLVVVIDDVRVFQVDHIRDGMRKYRAHAKHFVDCETALSYLMAMTAGSISPQFCTYIDELWLDHDLGWNAGTIMPVVDWLEELAHFYPENSRLIKKIFIHTANPVAQDKMVLALEKDYIVEVVWAETLGLLQS